VNRFAACDGAAIEARLLLKEAVDGTNSHLHGSTHRQVFEPAKQLGSPLQE